MAFIISKMNEIELRQECKKTAQNILNSMNGQVITKEEWAYCSDYAKQDLKRKARIVIKELLSEHSCYTLNDVRWAYWAQVEIELNAI